MRHAGTMQLPSGYILLLAKQPHRLRMLVTLLGHFNYGIEIARSEEQAVVQTVQQPPFLIILVGEHQTWSRQLMRELRAHANAHRITLLALTDFHAPSWIHQEENPGFDGFLVSPLSSDILSSLVQSAYTRQICSLVG